MPPIASWENAQRQHRRSRHAKKERHFNKRREKRKNSVLYGNKEETSNKQKQHRPFPLERIKNKWDKLLRMPGPLVDRDYRAVRNALSSRDPKRKGAAIGILIGWAVHRTLASLPPNSRAGHMLALLSSKQREATDLVVHLLARTRYFQQLTQHKASRQLARITAQVAELTRIAILMQCTDSGHFVRELPITWNDASNFWKLSGRPDRMGLVELNDGSTTLMIAELKTSRNLHDFDQQQLLFYGMLACLSYGLREHDKVKLVLRSLGSATEYTYWYPASRASRDLERVRRLLRQMEHHGYGGRVNNTMTWHSFVRAYQRLYPHEENKQLFRPSRILKDDSNFTELSSS